MKYVKDILALFFITAIVFGVYTLIMQVKKRNEIQNKEYYIIESQSTRYVTKSFDTTENTIRFTDMDDRQIEIHGNYTIIKK
jgi:hypothetical protein